MKHDYHFYISRGYDPKTAAYFAGGRRKITAVMPNDDFTLTLTFDNGEMRVFDVAPLIEPGTVFETFADIKHFRRVYLDETKCVAWDIDPNVDSDVVWNNKVDISSDTCYLDSVPLTEVSA